VYSVLGIVQRSVLKEKREKKSYGNDISYRQVSGTEAEMLTFRLGRSYFQSLNIYISILLIYVYAQRINFLRKRKLKYRRKYNKIVGILRKMSELLVKPGV